MYNKGLKIINKKGKEKNDKIAQKVIEHALFRMVTTVVPALQRCVALIVDASRPV